MKIPKRLDDVSHWLSCCLPYDNDKYGCGGCPYSEECDSLEDSVYVPVGMLEDLRDGLEELRKLLKEAQA